MCILAWGACVSIHASVMEATPFCGRHAESADVSIHASVMEATKAQAEGQLAREFRSTPP